MSEFTPILFPNSAPSTGALSLADPSQRKPDLPVDQILNALRMRWRLFWMITAACIGLAIAVSLLMTTKYEAVSRIAVNHKSASMLGLDEQLGEPDALDTSISLQTESQVLRSDTLALQIIQQLKLEQKPGYALTAIGKLLSSEKAEAGLPLEQAPIRRARLLKAFDKNLSVKTVSGTKIIEVKFYDRDPKVAADVCNTLVAAYVDQYYKTRFAATAQASDWLSSQLAGLKDDVERSQERLVEYQKQSGILGTDEAHNIITAKLETLNRQVSEAEANRIVHGAVYHLSKSGSSEFIAGMQPSATAGTEAQSSSGFGLLQNLRAQEAELKSQRASAVSKYGTAYPRVVQLDTQIAEMQESIRSEIGKTAERARVEYSAALDSERMLREALEHQKQEANRLNNSAIQYTILKHEVETSRELYDSLLKKLKEAGVIAGLRTARMTVVDPARVTAEPAKPGWLINLSLALAVGLLSAVGTVSILDGRDRRLYTPDQVEGNAGIAALGLIPDQNCRNIGTRKVFRLQKPTQLTFGKVPTLSSPESVTAEGFRSVRSSLLYNRRGENLNAILVTSSVPDEGKSTVSVNLAVVLAQQGSRVLLVDADLRRGSVHTILNLHPSPGLSAALAGAPPETCIKNYAGAANLSVVTCGVRPAYPSELLASQLMRDLLRKWRKEYDYVVIDSPPALSVTDPIVLSTQVDGVVIVVRSGQTSSETVVHTRDMLTRAGARISGVVLNGVDVGSAAYDKYAGHSFSGKYGAYYKDAAGVGGANA